MRGKPDRQLVMLSVLTPEQRVPAGHPIRRIEALRTPSSRVFDDMDSDKRRPPSRQSGCSRRSC
ncbi:MAG: hypothetical protein KatS3mg102_2302 [Planctomycetota bacterium]|nr:MAG: hypothetical protein KatS3mg102_2302 [Planctomycetota bacterium]